MSAQLLLLICSATCGNETEMPVSSWERYFKPLNNKLLWLLMYSKNANTNKSSVSHLLLEQEKCVQTPSSHKLLGVLILGRPFWPSSCKSEILWNCFFNFCNTRLRNTDCSIIKLDTFRYGEVKNSATMSLLLQHGSRFNPCCPTEIGAQ